MKTQKIIRSPLYILCILIICGCQTETPDQLIVNTEASTVFIDIDVENLLKSAKNGDEVPQYVKMFNGITDHTTGTHGEADLITELNAGEDIMWRLGHAEGVSIVGIEYFIVEGEDAFTLPGGSIPQQQPDGSWLAKTSSNLPMNSTLKYNVHFKVNGKTFWRDPLVKISSQG